MTWPRAIPAVIKKAGLIVLGLGCLYGLILGDLWLRSRQAYIKGEQYLRWHYHPEEKKSEIAQDFQKWKTALDRLAQKGRISPQEYRERLELAQLEKEERMQESSIKYAYVWFETTVELFSPPQNLWVRRARKKMVEVKELWKNELALQGVPFEDSMLEGP